MADDLAAVRTRIHGVQQLDTVIGAMRGIAAAHAQQSRQLLPGFRAYAEVIARAIASALRLRDAVRPAPSAASVAACASCSAPNRDLSAALRSEFWMRPWRVGRRTFS